MIYFEEKKFGPASIFSWGVRRCSTWRFQEYWCRDFRFLQICFEISKELSLAPRDACNKLSKYMYAVKSLQNAFNLFSQRGCLLINRARSLVVLSINAEKVHLYFYLIFSFRKQKLQAASTDLFNTLVPKAQNGECQNVLFSLQIRLEKVVTPQEVELARFPAHSAWYLTH